MTIIVPEIAIQAAASALRNDRGFIPARDKAERLAIVALEAALLSGAVVAREVLDAERREQEVLV